MVEEASVDAYGESEQLVGLYTMIEDHLAVPFETTLLGMPVTVKAVGLTEREEIVAICMRDRLQQAIPILDLVLPSPAPPGTEWIEAYRYWAGRG
jgi:Calcium binding